MILHGALLVLGLVFLVKGADFFISACTHLAQRLKISEWVIGVTVVAFGGSLPELVVSMSAVLQDSQSLALSNIMGSVMANICLVLGVAALIQPLMMKPGVLKIDIPVSLFCAAIILWFTWRPWDESAHMGLLTRGSGFLLIGIFCVYMLSVLKRSKASPEELHDGTWSLVKSTGFLILGFAGLILGSEWVVRGAVWLARSIGWSESLIGLTVVAIGTSLPELAASTVAAYRGKVDLAIANVVGSNIFNFSFVLGLSSSIKAMPFTKLDYVDGLAGLGFGIFIVIATWLHPQKAFSRVGGLIIIVLYGVYMAKRIGMG